MRPEPTHRVEWRHVYVQDQFTGKQRLAFVFPRKVPIRNLSWKDRFRTFGIFDVIVFGGAVVLLVLSVVMP